MKSPTLHHNHTHHSMDDLKPRNWPIPPAALFLVLGLIAAGALFFLPVLLNPGMEADQQTLNQAITE